MRLATASGEVCLLQDLGSWLSVPTWPWAHIGPSGRMRPFQSSEDYADFTTAELPFDISKYAQTAAPVTENARRFRHSGSAPLFRA